MFELLRLGVLVCAVAEDPDRAGKRNDRGGEQPELNQHVMELIGMHNLLLG